MAMKTRCFLQIILPALLMLCFLSMGNAYAQESELSVSPAAPADNKNALSPLNFTGYYAFDWRGIPIGKVFIEMNEWDNNSYRVRAVSKSQGLVNLFKKHKGEASTVGKSNSSGYFPILFETLYSIGKKHKHVKLKFNNRRNVIKEEVEPPINHRARPKIPASMKKNVFDILSAVMQLRHKIYEGYRSGKKSFSLDMFEGTRLMRIHVNLVESLLLKMDGSRKPALRLTLRRTPLAGFKNKELLEMKKGEPLLHMYFSRDSRMIPLKVALNYFGQLEGILRKECTSLELCMRGH